MTEELERIPMSQALQSTLLRARDYAKGQSHAQISLEHVMLALTEDEDAVQVLHACQLDLARLRHDLGGFFASINERYSAGGATEPQVSQALTQILKYATLAARQGRRPRIDGAIVLAALIGDGGSMAANFLKAQGLTFDQAIRVLQRSAAARPVARPGQPEPQHHTHSNYHPASPPPTPPMPDRLSQADPRSVNPRHAHAHPPPPMNGERIALGEASADAEDILAAARERVARGAGRGRGSDPSHDHRSRADPMPDGHAPDYAQARSEREPRAPSSRAQDSERPAPSPPYVPIPPRTPTGATPMSAPHPGPPPPSNGYAPAYYLPAVSERTAAAQPRSDIAQWPAWADAHPTNSQSLPASQNAPPLDRATGNGRSPGPNPSDQRRALSRIDLSGRDVARALPRGPAIETGHVTHSIPSRLKQNRPTVVEVRVSRPPLPGSTTPPGARPTSLRSETVVARAICVRLRTAKGVLAIDAPSPETQWDQAAGAGRMAGDEAVWRFTVAPQRAGQALFALSVSARTIGADAVIVETALPDQVIPVRVRPNVRRMVQQASIFALIGLGSVVLLEVLRTALKIDVPKLVSSLLGF